MCECLQGYSGRGCEVACPNRCSMHGQCVLGTCTCEHDWKGEDCSVEKSSVSAMMIKLSQGTVILTPGEAVTDMLGPWFTIGMALVILLVVIFIGGYWWNRYMGASGLSAIPFYNYVTNSIAYSDYQLKTPGSGAGM